MSNERSLIPMQTPDHEMGYIFAGFGYWVQDHGEYLVDESASRLPKVDGRIQVDPLGHGPTFGYVLGAEAIEKVNPMAYEMLEPTELHVLFHEPYAALRPRSDDIELHGSRLLISDKVSEELYRDWEISPNGGTTAKRSWDWSHYANCPTPSFSREGLILLADSLLEHTPQSIEALMLPVRRNLFRRIMGIEGRD